MTKVFDHSYKFIILMVISFMLIGCGLMESGDDEETTFDAFLDDPDYYVAGDSVRGGDFSFLDVKVDGYIWNEDQGEFVEIQDGIYIPPGEHLLGIKATSRRDPSFLSTSYEGLSDLVQGTPIDQRVYVGDGGNTYLVEARLDSKTGMYLCKYKVDGTYPVTPLLIEIVYRDGMAKKKKVILATRKNIRAPNNKIVKEGIVLGISSNWALDLVQNWAVKDKEIVKSVVSIGNSLLCDAFLLNFAYRIVDMDFVLNSVAPLVLAIADISPGKNSIVDAHLKNLSGLVTLGVDVEDLFEDGDMVEGPLPIEIDVSAVGISLAFDRIVQRVIPMVLASLGEPISLDLDALLEPIADDLFDVLLDVLDIKIDYAVQLVDELLDSLLPTNTRVFVNAFGRPEENTDDQFFAYVGLLATDSRKLPSNDDLKLNGRCFPEWPENTIMDDSVRMDLSPIKGENVDIGVAVNGYWFNSLFSEIFDHYELTAPPTIMNIAFAILAQLKEDATSELSMKVKFNPQGFVFDIHDASDGTVKGNILVYDLQLTLQDNTAAVTKISVDIVIDFTLGFHWENGNWIADLDLIVEPEKSTMHVIDDLIGVTFLDHSALISAIADVIFFGNTIPDQVRPIQLDIDFTDILGVYVTEEGTSISSKDGNVYITLGLDPENPLNWDTLGGWLEAAFEVNN